MPIEIRPITEGDIPGFRDAVDAVARERRFLTLLEAPSLDATTAFVRSNIDDGNPGFVALADGHLVGWCDIVRNSRRAIHRHRGTLGIGIIAPYRGQGLGRRLMHAATDAAWAAGMTRVELLVRADNTAAARLYRKMGFELEGLQRQADLIDGIYYDVQAMALLATVR